jgi:hypothetical protein
MNFDATIKNILVALLLVASIPTTFLFWKKPVPIMSASEKELIGFSSQPLTMSPPRSQTVFSALDFPVRITSKQPVQATQPPQAAPATQAAPVAGGTPKGFPPGPIPSANVGAEAPAKPVQPNSFGSKHVVSMIYSEGSVKTAVIDGNVLHEGSVFGKSQVVSIEKTRVLVRTAGKDIWLKID